MPPPEWRVSDHTFLDAAPKATPRGASMRRSASLRVLVSGCLLFAPTGSPEASSPRSDPAVLVAQFADASQPHGKLVLVGTNYSTFEGAQQGLYVVNVDGRGLRQITVGTDQEPHWSPNGRWIAYVHAVGLSQRVMIVRGDGSGRPRMLGGGETRGLAAPSPWSPDGRLLVWGGCRGLCVFDLASSRHRSIALGGGDSDGFAWSPDGRKLVAVDGSGRLVVVDPAARRKPSSRPRASIRPGRPTAGRSRSAMPSSTSNWCLPAAAVPALSPGTQLLGRPGHPTAGGCSTANTHAQPVRGSGA